MSGGLDIRGHAIKLHIGMLRGNRHSSQFHILSYPIPVNDLRTQFHIANRTLSPWEMAMLHRATYFPQYGTGFSSAKPAFRLNAPFPDRDRSALPPKRTALDRHHVATKP
jgi:hypothetical protein